MAESNTTARNVRKERKGFVLGKSGDKSIVVTVERRVRHPVYGKVMRKTRKFHVHDEANAAAPGDYVRILETRPLSKLKRWRLVEVLKKAEVEEQG